MPAAVGDAWRDQVHQGLVGLGWSAKEAEAAVDAVAPEAGRPRRTSPAAAARRPAHAEQGLSVTRERPGRQLEAPRATTSQSLTAAEAEGDERAVEAALRPRTLDEVDRPGAGARAARAGARGGPASAAGRPTTCCCPARPGSGKTTLAMIIAAEMAAPLRLTSGPAITHAGDLAAILSGLNEGDVLFVDEIHRMSRPAEEMLYMAMEDFRVDVVIGKGPGATAIPLEIPPFTLVGATTRAGLLPGPLRDRFGFTAHLEFYEADDLERIVRRSAGLLDVELDADGAAEIASRSRGTPRIANRLLRRVRDFAQVARRRRRHPRRGPARRWSSSRSTSSASTGSTVPCSTRCAAASAADRSASRTLAVAVGEERETVEEVAEPFLVRNGFLARTPRGRVATAAAWGHLGLTAPPPPPPRPATRHCSTTESRAHRSDRRGCRDPHHPRLHFTVGRPG